MKRKIQIIILSLIVAGSAMAQKSEVFAPDGKAIRGYDPVAFFKEGKPVMGNADFTMTWKDAKWFFVSKENLDNFRANPEKFAPQYGGYCVYGASEGHKAPSQPETWTIINDKLYFNYNSKVKEEWIRNTDSLIKKADMAWPVLRSKQ